MFSFLVLSSMFNDRHNVLFVHCLLVKRVWELGMFTLSVCLSCITWETPKWISYIFTNTFANTNTNIRTNLCGSGGCLHCLSVIAASHVNSKQLYFDVNQVKIGENMLSFYAQSKGEIIITGRDFKYQSHGHKCTGTWKIQQMWKD